MTVEELTNILDSLLILPAETEVVEFKRAERNFDDRDLGQYFSALSNEANLKGRPCAWLVFGVENHTHEVVGSQYKNSRPALDAMKKKIADQTTGRHTFVEIHELRYRNGKRVVMFEIPPAPQGIPIDYQGHYYGRDGESLQALSMDKIERIRNQAKLKDWSAEIIENASLEDLDPAAIVKARELYTNARKDKADEIASWDDTTFLNKAKITIRGKITNTAIVLLGREESEHLISPAVAKIKWILRGPDNVERDYMIASCPFILAVDKIYDKIRNLKYRYINPEYKTLFPEEIDTYEPYVIREALNNAIAHRGLYARRSDQRSGIRRQTGLLEQGFVYSRQYRTGTRQRCSGGAIPKSISGNGYGGTQDGRYDRQRHPQDVQLPKTETISPAGLQFGRQSGRSYHNGQNSRYELRQYSGGKCGFEPARHRAAEPCTTGETVIR